MTFEPTTRWLKRFLIENNYAEIANQIDYLLHDYVRAFLFLDNEPLSFPFNRN